MKKLILNELETKLVFSETSITTFVIEKQKKLYDYIKMLIRQSNEEEGDFIITEETDTISFSKKVFVLSNIFDFEVNSKKTQLLLSRKIQSLSNESKYLQRVYNIHDIIFKIINDMSFDINIPLELNEDIDFISIIKAYGVKIKEEENSLLEKLIILIDIIYELSRISVFIITFIFEVLNKEELEKLVKHCIYKEISILAIEGNCPKYKLLGEKRLIVDEDLCEIIENG